MQPTGRGPVRPRVNGKPEFRAEPLAVAGADRFAERGTDDEPEPGPDGKPQLRTDPRPNGEPELRADRGTDDEPQCAADDEPQCAADDDPDRGPDDVHRERMCRE